MKALKAACMLCPYHLAQCTHQHKQLNRCPTSLRYIRSIRHTINLQKSIEGHDTGGLQGSMTTTFKIILLPCFPDCRKLRSEDSLL